MLRAAVAAMRSVYASLRRWSERIRFDRPAGIETTKIVPLSTLGLDARHRQDYHPTPWPLLKRALSEYQPRTHDVFIDFGCGKGRVLVEAAKYPFRRVIGVEISSELADIARQNVERSRSTLACQAIEVITADVVNFQLPDDVTVVYFFDPFHGDIFSTVIANLLSSLHRRPRVLTIIYMDPEEEQCLLDAGAQLIKSLGGMRPTRKWSQENSVRIYELSPVAPTVVR